MASHDLVGRDGDAAPLVLRFQDAALDELVPHLIPDLLVIFQAQRAGCLALPGVDILLNDRLVGPRVDALAVDLADRGLGQQTGAARDAAQVEHQPGEEGESDDDHQRFGGVAEGLHHRDSRDSGRRV